MPGCSPRYGLAHFHEQAGPRAVFSLACDGAGAGVARITTLERALSRRPELHRDTSDSKGIELDIDVDELGGNSEGVGLVAPGLQHLPADDAQQRVFFRVVRCQPSKQKVQSRGAAAGLRLPSDAVAIELLGLGSAESVNEGGMMPLMMDDAMQSRPCILSFDRSDHQTLSQEFHRHNALPTVAYAIVDRDIENLESGVNGQGARVVQACIAANALPGQSGGTTLDEEFIGVARQLAEKGYIEEVSGGDSGLGAVTWRLSVEGLKRIRAYREVQPGKKVFERRPLIPLEDLDTYELLTELLDTGWSWEPLPGSRSKARAALKSYHVGVGLSCCVGHRGTYYNLSTSPPFHPPPFHLSCHISFHVASA